MRIRKTHTHTLNLPACLLQVWDRVCVCVCVFIGISSSFSCKVRTEFPCRHSLSLTHSLSLPHPRSCAGAEDKANNELLRQLEEVVEYFVHAERKRERETWRDLIGIAVFLTVNWFCAGQTVWQALLTTEISNNNGNHFPYKMQQQINSDNNNNYKKRASQQKRTSERESCNDEMSKQWGVCCCNHLLHHTTQSRSEYTTHTNKHTRTQTHTHIAAVVVVIVW